MKTISISQWVAAAVNPARGVHAASSSASPHDELILTLPPMRELKRTEVRAPAISANPNGIPSLSPGLRGTSYPGSECQTEHNPERVASLRTNPRCNPIVVENIFARLPKVGARRANLGLNDAIPLGLKIGKTMKTISISQRAAAAANKARGVHAASSSARPPAELIPTLPAIRELKRTEVRAPAISANPNGIPALSPGLRGTSYPGCESKTDHNPERVASLRTNPRCNPIGVENIFARLPKVGAQRANLGLNDAIPLGLTERGVYAALPSKRSHAHELIPTLFAVRELKRPEGRAAVLALGMLLFTTFATFAQVNLPIGALLPGEKVTLTFDVTITNPFPASATAVTNQGTVSGSNFATVNSDDPATGPVGDATVTPVFVPPAITSATNATFTVGINGVFNVSRTGVPTPDLFISGTIPNNIGFNPGTGNLGGTPSIGTGGTYPLVITATNATGTNVQNFTLTVLEAPALGCPPNVTTNNASGQCARVLAFSANVTHGYPTPVVTYKIGTSVITSPYAFPVGTNTVIVTATNGVPTDKTCSFTVVVRDTEAPTPTCPANIVLTNIAGNCPASVNFSVSGTDNCGAPTVAASPPSGSAFALGTNTVTVLATDAAGNTNTCSFTVTLLPGPGPLLSIWQADTNVVLCWSNIFTCYSLQYTPDFVVSPGTSVWTIYPGPFSTNGGNIYVTNGIGATNRFFRLTTGSASAACIIAPSGLVSWWRAESNATDVVSANNGTLTNGATFAVGEVGTAFSFDGLDDAVTVTNVVGLADGNAPHTIEAWVKASAYPAVRSWPLLLGNEGAGAHHWLLNPGGDTQIGVFAGPQLAPPLPVGVWVHVAASFDGTTLRVYTNGVSAGSVAASFNLQGKPLTLAQAHQGQDFFAGLIDELSIYNRALSDSEIAAIYNAGSLGKCAGGP